MNEQLVLTLLSGFIGAIGGSIITIGFTLWKDNKQENRRTAKEKLEKVYGPLVALKKKIDLRNRSDGGFLLPSTTQEIAVISLVTKLTTQEVEMIEKIIFHYYYLVDEDLKEDIVLLHSDLRNDITNQIRFPSLMDKIKKHYQENKDILGLK